MKQVYLVRHCKASGQEPMAPLTEEGLAQAERLAEFLASPGVERIVSSPYRRAIQSVEPLAERLGLALEVEERFAEWVLAKEQADSYEAFLEQIRASFADPTLAYSGGESGNALTERALAALADVLSGSASVTVVALHGGILSHLLRHHLPNFGFDDWQRLSNPDVYRLTVDGDGVRDVTRAWNP